MIYEIDFTEQAKKEIAELKKSNKLSYNKVVKLLAELMEHPETPRNRHRKTRTYEVRFFGSLE